MKHQCASSVFSFPVSPRMSLVVACQPGTLVKFLLVLYLLLPVVLFFVSLSRTLTCGMFVWLFLLVCSLSCISCGLEVSFKASMESGRTFCDPVYTATGLTSGGACVTCSVRLGSAPALPHPSPHTCPRPLFSQCGYFILQRVPVPAAPAPLEMC